MKVLFTRHGQTNWNAEDKVQGRTDIPLNENGRAQARKLGETLLDKRIGLIFCSPLVRAKETSEIISKILGDICVCVDERLIERNFGIFEGKYYDGPKKEVNIDSMRKWSEHVPTPGGETIDDVVKRVFAFMDEKKPEFLKFDKNVLIVAHGHIVRPIYWYFNGLPEKDEILIHSENCQAYEFEL